MIHILLNNCTLVASQPLLIQGYFTSHRVRIAGGFLGVGYSSRFKDLRKTVPAAGPKSHSPNYTSNLDSLKIKQSLRHSWLQREGKTSIKPFTQTMLSCSFCNCQQDSLNSHFLHPSSSTIRSSTSKALHTPCNHEFLFLLFTDVMPHVHSQSSSGRSCHSPALSLAPLKVDLSELALTHPQK